MRSLQRPLQFALTGETTPNHLIRQQVVTRDVRFGDDYTRGHTGHVAHNLALVRHIALNLLRLNTSRKTSIKTRRLLAATSDEYRAELLGFEIEDDDD